MKLKNGYLEEKCPVTEWTLPESRMFLCLGPSDLCRESSKTKAKTRANAAVPMNCKGVVCVCVCLFLSV